MAISWRKLKERANQVSGFTLPFIGAGLSWQPKELDMTKARKLIIFLEDRRVLYYESEWESMPHVIRSVLEIRKYIVGNILMESDQDTPLYDSAKRLRDACIEFLDLSDKLERRSGGIPDWTESNYRLMRMILGRIRRMFGRELLQISICYQVDIDEDLAKIIPVAPNHDESLLSEELE